MEAEPHARVPKMKGKRNARIVSRKLKQTAEEKHVEKEVEEQKKKVKDVVVGKEEVNLVQTRGQTKKQLNRKKESKMVEE